MESVWESTESMGVKSRENEILFGDLKQTTQLTIHGNQRQSNIYKNLSI
jgi:hypothetical protein